jgi:hypothetical protein
VQTLIEHGARGVDGFGDDIEDAGGINHRSSCDSHLRRDIAGAWPEADEISGNA